MQIHWKMDFSFFLEPYLFSFCFWFLYLYHLLNTINEIMILALQISHKLVRFYMKLISNYYKPYRCCAYPRQDIFNQYFITEHRNKKIQDWNMHIFIKLFDSWHWINSEIRTINLPVHKIQKFNKIIKRIENHFFYLS